MVDVPADRLDEHLAAHERKDLLRFLTCGSVDDGKSTLLGRLLHDAGLVLADQLAAVRSGPAGEPDLALLVDGLQAEREQGITIDVAHRYFTTDRRKFIVADTPGHEQYTRNMVTGASTADLAVVLVDARKGVVRQTRRHSCVVALLGIRRVVLAVNKLDLCGWDEQVFAEVERDYRAFAREVGVDHVTCVPVSALHGDNVVTPSANTPWYGGPTLLRHLEETPVDGGDTGPFRLAVQHVARPD
ncbi:GTP-binding protein, partial [Actinosynnema sp. NPDC059797]